MRKYLHTACGLILWANVAFAGWWPSESSPASYEFERGNAALSGAVERLSVVAGPWAWTNYAVPTIWGDHFSQFAKLQAAKNMIKVAYNGNYENLWLSRTNSYSAIAPLPNNTYITNYPGGYYSYIFPIFDLVGTLTNAGAPADYLDKTTHFSLASDPYGWRYIPLVLSNMTTYLELFEPVFQGFGVTNGIHYLWVGTNLTTFGYYGYDLEVNDGTNISAKIVSDRFWDQQYSTTTATNSEFVGHVWIYIAPTLSGTFDPQTANVSTQAVKYLDWTNAVGSQTSPWFSFFTNKTSRPPNYNGASLGWTEEIFGPDIQIVYDFAGTTNGFKWFK